MVPLKDGSSGPIVRVTSMMMHVVLDGMEGLVRLLKGPLDATENSLLKGEDLDMRLLIKAWRIGFFMLLMSSAPHQPTEKSNGKKPMAGHGGAGAVTQRASGCHGEQSSER
jgi:hypothetical protein